MCQMLNLPREMLSNATVGVPSSKICLSRSVGGTSAWLTASESAVGGLPDADELILLYVALALLIFHHQFVSPTFECNLFFFLLAVSRFQTFFVLINRSSSLENFIRI